MKRFLIEREIPGVGKFDAEALSDAARTSNQALAKLGPDIQWVVTARNDGAEPGLVFAYAQCAAYTP